MCEQICTKLYEEKKILTLSLGYGGLFYITDVTDVFQLSVFQLSLFSNSIITSYRTDQAIVIRVF